VNLHRDPVTGDIVLDSVDANARMPMYRNTDFNFAHSFHVSKTNEAMKIGLEWNILNIFNNRSVLSYYTNPFARNDTTYLHFDSAANPAGYDFLTALSGFDPFARANQALPGKLTLNGQYALPFLYQNARTMRVGLRFTF